MLTLTGHTGPLTALCFSPDGRTLISAGRDATVRFWDMATMTERMRTEHAQVQALAVSPDGQTLVTGGASVRFWSLADGELVSEVLAKTLGLTVGVTGLAYLKATTLAITAGDRLRADAGGGVVLWDVVNRRLRERCYANVTALTAQGPTLAWACGDRKLLCRDITQPQPIVLPSLKSVSLALALSADGQTVAVADDWTVRLLDVPQRRERLVLRGHKGAVQAVAFVPHCSVLVSAGRDEAVRFWNLTEASEMATYHWPVGRLHALAFSPEGLLGAVGGETGRIQVWDVN